MVCHCLQVTETMLTEAIGRFSLQTIDEVRRHIGAGDGCTACHYRIRLFLEAAQASSSSPICSVR
jgi:bacterioferritin-associated ferredoxin